MMLFERRLWSCWNHAKILPQPVTVTSGPSDAVIDELKALLVEFSDSSLDVENVVDHATEQWTAAPQSDDEDAAAAYEAREESDGEDADDSEPVVPMTLPVREARAIGQAFKVFVQKNERGDRVNGEGDGGNDGVCEVSANQYA